jgi:copper chaperone
MILFASNPDFIANQYEVSLERQNVKVWGPSLPPFSTVEEKIKKTGKTVSLL